MVGCVKAASKPRVNINWHFDTRDKNETVVTWYGPLDIPRAIIRHVVALLGVPGGKCHIHDDVIKWKHFPRYWPFVRGIHRSPVNSPHKGQWRRALVFSVIYAWINDWVNNREAGDLRRHRAHYDVIVMTTQFFLIIFQSNYCYLPLSDGVKT